MASFLSLWPLFALLLPPSVLILGLSPCGGGLSYILMLIVLPQPPGLSSAVYKPPLMHVHRPEFGSKDKEFVMQKGSRKLMPKKHTWKLLVHCRRKVIAWRQAAPTVLRKSAAGTWASMASQLQEFDERWYPSACSCFPPSRCLPSAAVPATPLAVLKSLLCAARLVMSWDSPPIFFCCSSRSAWAPSVPAAPAGPRHVRVPPPGLQPGSRQGETRRELSGGGRIIARVLPQVFCPERRLDSPCLLL